MGHFFSSISERLSSARFMSQASAPSVEVSAAEAYTPREFVAGFIALPRGAKAVDAAWHAAAIALETERVRLIHRAADGGVYFIAAAAGEFASHPDAASPLASALPDTPGHRGNGAYLVEMGGGIVAAVVKEQGGMQSYVGERDDVMRFVADLAVHWPSEMEVWVGYRQIEQRRAWRTSVAAIVAGVLASGLFIALAVAASTLDGFVKHRKDLALDSMRSEQQATAASMNVKPPDAFGDYVTFSQRVVALGGKLNRYEATGGAQLFEAEIPRWATDLSQLGSGVQTKLDGDHIVVTR